MIVIKVSREQWRALGRIAKRCPELSRHTADTIDAHGDFRGVSRDSVKSAAGIDAAEARAMLSAARAECAELAKRPRFLDNPRFIATRDAACILSAALDAAGYVSDCH